MCWMRPTGKLLAGKPYVPTLNWMTGLDANGRPILNPEANYGKTGRGFNVVPSAGGAHSWHPMAFNPGTGLVYIPTNYSSFPLVAEAGAKMGNQLLSINVAKRPQDPPPKLDGAGTYLLAWDPVGMKEVWKQPEGGPRSGVMTTAGNLVFEGSAPRSFSAFRADTGERVWTTDVQSGIAGGSLAMRSVEQYVAVVSGTTGFGGNYWAPIYSRLLVYKLNGNATLPPPAAYTPPVLNPPVEFGDDALRAQGLAQYTAHCGSCHGSGTESRVSSVFPDLRYAGAIWSAEAFKAIVIDGACRRTGWCRFGKCWRTRTPRQFVPMSCTLSNQAKNALPGGGLVGGGGAGTRSGRWCDSSARRRCSGGPSADLSPVRRTPLSWVRVVFDGQGCGAEALEAVPGEAVAGSWAGMASARTAPACSSTVM